MFIFQILPLFGSTENLKRMAVEIQERANRRAIEQEEKNTRQRLKEESKKPETEAAYQRLEDTIYGAQEKWQDLYTRVRELEAQLSLQSSEFELEKAELEQQLQEKEDQLQKLAAGEGDIADLRDHVKQMEGTIEGLEQQNKALQDDIETLQNSFLTKAPSTSVPGYSDYIKRLQDDLKAAHEDADQKKVLEEKFNSLFVHNARLIQENDALKSKAHDLAPLPPPEREKDRKIQELDQLKTVLEDKIKTLQNTLDEERQKNSKLQEHFDASLQALDKISDQEEWVRKQQKQIAEAEQVKNQLSILKTDLDQVTQQFLLAQAENAHLKGEIKKYSVDRELQAKQSEDFDTALSEKYDELKEQLRIENEEELKQRLAEFDQKILEEKAQWERQKAQEEEKLLAKAKNLMAREETLKKKEAEAMELEELRKRLEIETKAAEETSVKLSEQLRSIEEQRMQVRGEQHKAESLRKVLEEKEVSINQERERLIAENQQYRETLEQMEATIQYYHEQLDAYRSQLEQATQNIENRVRSLFEEIHPGVLEILKIMIVDIDREAKKLPKDTTKKTAQQMQQRYRSIETLSTLIEARYKEIESPGGNKRTAEQAANEMLSELIKTIRSPTGRQVSLTLPASPPRRDTPSPAPSTLISSSRPPSPETPERSITSSSILSPEVAMKIAHEHLFDQIDQLQRENVMLKLQVAELSRTLDASPREQRDLELEKREQIIEQISKIFAQAAQASETNPKQQLIALKKEILDILAPQNAPLDASTG